jgi:glutamate synthase domain-containing protein 2
MKIGTKFNRLTYREYIQILDRHEKYTDFNTLGLYRSIIENDKLNLEDKIAIRDLAHQKFSKTFEFLQLKDPYVYFQVSTLGRVLTTADEQQLWEDIRHNQQKILKAKRIKHRNFGEYSKHNCGYETCPYNGMMIRQGSMLAESNMHFNSDVNYRSWKADRRSIAKRKLRDGQTESIDEMNNDLQPLN